MSQVNTIEAVAGKPAVLSELVTRVTCPNPGVMTGPGTNSYLIGKERLALIDPGPIEDSHIQLLLETVGDRLGWIIATHTHTDHSPGAKQIAEATGAQIIGALVPDNMHQDQTFNPDREITHDEVISTDDFTLRAIHTPGHVSNHYCFLLEEEGLLFTGDHIMNGSTVVIVPPSGDMKAYIESLELLLDYPLVALAPAHGALMENPEGVVRWIIDHRLQREQKVVNAMSSAFIDLDDLVLSVYDDVDPGLYPMAKLSLSAHLIKLRDEDRAASEEQNWRLI
jgi:glyoxylase-like metal-dependent hydrolase (beta-lactamase superfamily II)